MTTKTKEEIYREDFEAKRKGDDLSTILLCGNKAYWNKTVQRDWEMYLAGRKASEAEIESKECVICGASDNDISKYNTELHKTIQQQKEEIDALKKTIKETKEILSALHAWFYIKRTRTAPIEFLEKAKGMIGQ